VQATLAARRNVIEDDHIQGEFGEELAPGDYEEFTSRAMDLLATEEVRLVPGLYLHPTARPSLLDLR